MSFLQVSLSIDRLSAEPGQPVKFKVNQDFQFVIFICEYQVKADPNSYVGLLAVDQSVLLLKSGNDITKEMVRRREREGE